MRCCPSWRSNSCSRFRTEVRRLKQQWIGAAVLAAALAAAVAGAAWPGPAPVPERATVGVIRIEGPITSGSDGSLFVGALGADADRLMEALDRARRDPAVKAVVLRVNSPGGTVGATYEIAREVERLKESGRKVVVSMGDAAASGGYYIAAQADYIYATPGTLTGSIGVLLSLANLQELYRKIGYEPVILKSGEMKDLGNPGRPMTDAERRFLQAQIDRIYDDFVSAVARGRKLPKEQVLKVADGRFYDGLQAKELELVDALGNYKDAVRKAAELAGLAEGQYQVREFGKPSPIEVLTGLPGALSRLAAVLEAGPAGLLQRQGTPPAPPAHGGAPLPYGEAPLQYR